MPKKGADMRELIALTPRHDAQGRERSIPGSPDDGMASVLECRADGFRDTHFRCACQRWKRNMIKILIADDHAVVRSGLKQIVATATDIAVVDEAVSGA